MYPAGHPSQDRSASGVVQRLAALLADRASVSIGVARRQLVIEGVATDPKHPVLRSLAEKFHRQHIGAVVFNRGVSTREIVEMMRLVAAEPEKDGRPLGLSDADKLKQWPYVRLYALTYDQLELIGKAEDEEGVDEEEREQGTRSAQLWIGLARAALSAEDRDAEPASTDPALVADAINEHPQAQAYDQVVVGYLLQIAQELKKDGGTASTAVRRRMSRLIGALDHDTLNRLVAMGGDLAQRKQFALDATESLAADAVVEIVRAAAETSGQTISNSLMRMLSKLSAFAERGSQTMQAQADTALREQVRELVTDWRLVDPNPDAYTLALQAMSSQSTGERKAAETHAPEPTRIIKMAIEVAAVGVPFWRAVATIEASGGVSEIVEILRHAAPDNPAAMQLWTHLATEANVRALLRENIVDFTVVNVLIERLPQQTAAMILLDTIIESESRATRMGVFKALVAMGAAIADRLIEKLDDRRWYVQRNMLAIMNEMAYVPATFSPANYARMPDARVRREALTMWLRVPRERDRAILASLKDTDDRALRVGLHAALQGGAPDTAIPVITARLADPRLTMDLQMQMVRVIGQSQNALAVDTLLKVVLAGKTIFGAPKFAETTPVVLVALATLAERWSTDFRVKPVLERAIDSKDPDIKAAVQKAGFAK